VQSANDTNDAKGRQAIAAEIGELKEQVRNVLVGTEFNGRKLFVSQGKSAPATQADITNAAKALGQGSAAATGGKGAGDTQLITDGATLPIATEAVKDFSTANGFSVQANKEAENNQAALEHFAKLTGQSDIKIAANGNGLAKGQFYVKATNGNQADGTYELFMNTDGGNTSVKVNAKANRSDLESFAEARVGDQVALKSKVAAPTEDIKFQVGANNAKTDSLTIATSDIDLFKSVYDKLGSDALDVSSNVKARQSVDDIDKLISSVSEVRGKLGATQNRLDHTVNSIKVSVENLTASESRIRDTDMAEEMMSMTRAQIL
ncbi:flagellin, partial [Stomatohabitans albus]